MPTKNEIEFTPSRVQELSPREFVSLYKECPGEVKRVYFKTPRIGSKSFGSFVVVRKHPVYTTPACTARSKHYHGR